MMRVLSPIYPPEIKPVRDGWYLYKTSFSDLWILREWRDGCWRTARGDEYSTYPHEDPEGWRGMDFDASGAMCEIDAETGLWGVFVPGATCE